MRDRDEVAITNQKLWEDEVKKGCGYTIPWLDIDIPTLQQFAQGELEFLPEPLTCMYPADFFADVRGKDVLCLASGGGQQSAVFGLLGAQVTVIDLADGQLAGDRKAAEHYGYDITTLQADMRDLSALDDSSFDLIYQANSVAYIPDIKELYVGVSRVLKSGGLYRICVGQPATHLVKWDGKAYFISKPYAEKVYRRPDGVGIEFRHYMDDLFNGLLDLGFSIQRIHEAPYARLPHYLNAPPGSWNHERSHVAGEFVIVAKTGKTF